jgi:hypothetical protein
MKRFWLLVLLMAGSLVSLYTPAFADDDQTEDINQALGSIKSQVNDLSKAIGNIGLYGDARFKYAWTTQSSGNSALTIPDSDKVQIRARLGVKKTFGDAEVNIRLVTDAAPGYPSSNTPSIGDALADQIAYFDLASVAWTPSFLGKQVKLTGGKFVNNLDYTPITWDETLTLDGGSISFMLPDVGTKLTTNFISFLNNQGAKDQAATIFGSITNPALPSPYSITDANQSFVWTTQLSQDVKLDEDNKLHFMLGYEYIPNVSVIANDLTWNGNTLAKDGNTQSVNANGQAWYPDVQMAEFMAQYSGKLFADVPWKWTLHITDNLGAQNLSNAYVLGNGTVSATSTNSALSTSMGYWLSVDLGASSTNPAKDAFGAQLALAYLEPNEQLAFLTDHDGLFTNTEYFRGILSFGVENNFALQYKTWINYHVYYDAPLASVGSSLTSAGGASQTAEWTNFLYATVSF